MSIDFTPSTEHSPFEADQPPSREVPSPRYFLADSRDGDLMLWRDNGHDDPTAIMGDYECTGETWRLLLRGAGLDPDTVCVSREDLATALYHLDQDGDAKVGASLEAALNRGEATPEPGYTCARCGAHPIHLIEPCERHADREATR